MARRPKMKKVLVGFDPAQFDRIGERSPKGKRNKYIRDAVTVGIAVLDAVGEIGQAACGNKAPSERPKKERGLSEASQPTHKKESE